MRTPEVASVPDDLRSVVEAWPTLSADARAQIVKLAKP